MNKNYQTKQKNIVNDFLSSHEEAHFTIEQMLKEIETSGCVFSKATLYRILDQMIASKQVERYNINGVYCYHYNKDSCHNFIHFSCEKCGNVYHLPANIIHNVDDKINNQLGLEVDLNKTVLYGVCNKCKEGIHEQN